MKIFKIGDTINSACETCQQFTTSTFDLKDVPFSTGEGRVKDVLVANCNSCGTLTLLPHQSTPMVQRFLMEKRKPIESRVPAHFVDILNLIAQKIGANIDFIPNLLKYYIHRINQEPKIAAKLSGYSMHQLAIGKANKRISLKGKRVFDELVDLKQSTNIHSTSQVIKCIILLMHDELLEEENEEILIDLRKIMVAIA